MTNGTRPFGDSFLPLLRKGAVFLYRCLIAPRSQDEDIRRKEFILNLILVGTLFLVAWSYVFVLISFLRGQATAYYVTLLPFSIVSLVFICLYIASRLGYVRLASYGLIFIYTMGTVYTTARWGASLPVGILCYAVIMTISSVLISSRFGLLITLVPIASVVIFGHREIATGELPLWKQGLIKRFDIIEYCLLFGVISIVSWLSSTEIEKSLRRARASEAALTEERDSLEVKVEERTQELQQVHIEKMTQLYRFAEFGRLSSGMFHDLINPLTSVSLNLETVKDSLHPEVKVAKESLNRAIKASQRLSVLMSTIKKQVRSDSTKLLFSANDAIEEILTLFDYKSKAMNISIEFHADEIIELFGSPIHFEQILTNLISNALDSYDSLEIETSRRIISITAFKEETHARITIEDCGHGIPADIIGRIFDPFFSTKPLVQGMGLGLSTVKSVLKNDFDGTISVESEPNVRTIFTITIPFPHESNYDSLGKTP